MSQVAVIVANTVWEPLSLLTPSSLPHESPSFLMLVFSLCIIRLLGYLHTHTLSFTLLHNSYSLLPSLTPSFSLAVPCIVSLVPPPPLGLGDFAFVCDSGVSEARGGGKV